MNTTSLRRLAYQIRHEYMTLNNIVLAIAIVIAMSWTWGSVSMMQRNYALQKQLDDKQRQQTLAELEVQNLKYQQRYYQSMEYQELSARENLGLVSPGEKVLTLPPNTPAATEFDRPATTAVAPREEASNARQWVNFLLGGTAEGLKS